MRRERCKNGIDNFQRSTVFKDEDEIILRTRIFSNLNRGHAGFSVSSSSSVKCSVFSRSRPALTPPYSHANPDASRVKTQVKLKSSQVHTCSILAFPCLPLVWCIRCQISTADRTHARTGPDTQRALQAHNQTQNRCNPRTHLRQAFDADDAFTCTRMRMVHNMLHSILDALSDKHVFYM